MSKRLFASAVVGTMLVISAVLVVSLIGGDDKPDITNDVPQEDEQLPDDSQDDTPVDDDPSDSDTSDDTADDTTDAETTSDDDDSESDDDTSDEDETDDDAEDEVPDEDDDEGPDDEKNGNGECNGNCYQHAEAFAGSSQMNCANNYAEHVSTVDVDSGQNCECSGGDDDNGQSGN